MRKALIAAALLLLIALAVTFALAPRLAENAMNVVLQKPPYHASERARALAKSILIVDLHADSLLWSRDLNRRSDRGQVDVPRLIEGGVAVQAFTIVTKTPRGLNFDYNRASDRDNITLLAMLSLWPPRTWGSLKERALYQAERLRQAVESSDGKLVFIRTRADLEAYLARRAGNPAVTAGFLGIEGAHALEGDARNVDVLYDAGIRMMSPTHFFDNEVAGSSAGEHKGGLTETGREVIRRMEQKHMLVDIAHASEVAIDEVLAMATRPVVSSHTGVKGTCDNRRNLSDKHLRRVAAGGGVAGIAFFKQAVCGEDAASIVRAMRHAVSVAGIDHVALGSDFDGAITAPFDTTGLPVLFDEMLRQGFSEDDIGKIAGDNALRVLRQVLP